MAIRVALHHHTSYRFDRPVGVSPHVIRLRPAPHARTPIRAYSLKIERAKHFINWLQDPFGNFQARLVFPEKIRELAITVDLVAEMTVINPFDFFVEDYAEKYGFDYEPTLRQELAPYLEIQENGPFLREWLAGANREPVRIVDFLVYLNQRLNQDIFYLIRMEPGVQTCEETLEKRSGSCRDSAWLLARLGLVAGADPAAFRVGGTFRIRLSDPTDRRCEGAGRPIRSRSRFHRSACLGRGVRAGRGLARPGSDLGFIRRRRPYSAGLHPDAAQRCTGHGLYRRMRNDFRVRDEGHPHSRGSARHQTLQRRAMGADRAARSRRGRAIGRG